jgi:hypothetical protein
MQPRPVVVTIAGVLLLAGAAIGLVMHRADPIPLAINVIGIICAVFLMRGANWARWLGLLWVAGHLVIGAIEAPRTLIVHGVLFALIAYLLLRRDARAYFGTSRPA